MPGEPGGGNCDRRPMRVLLLSADRRFREALSLLLTRRGCEVSLATGALALDRRLERERIQVVVIDAGGSLAAAARTVAAVQAMSRAVGVVVVEDNPVPVLPALRAVPKWGAFAELFAAVEQACAEQSQTSEASS